MHIIMLSKYDEDIMVLYREDEKLKYKCIKDGIWR